MPWFMDVHNVWMVPLYPLAAFILIVLLRSSVLRAPEGATGPLANKKTAMALTVGATFLGLLHAVGVLGWLFAQGGHVKPIEFNTTWIQAGDFKLSVGYLLDSMTAMMLFVVTFISLFIQIYTNGYMGHDKGYAKFYAYLALFNFSMLGLVLSTNLFQIYIFWELVGVSSYLLIGFWFTKPSAAAACIKAFLMNRVGDFGFLVGILALLFTSYHAGTWNWHNYLMAHPDQALLSFRALGDVAGALLPVIGAGGLGIIALLIFMGPMAKSAQVPLHTWLPDAMEGPTPISALIHAATMVAAGVYLIGRAFPLFEASEMAMGVVTTIGVLTALVGATIALTQTDIKKALAYSTMSQLGYMVAAMGVGAFTAGLFHLFTHAFFKALLFLCSGSVIHACEDEQDMRRMGGLFGKLPATAWTYLIGTAAISGFPLMSAFFSKDGILEGAAEHNALAYWILMGVAGLTAFYMFRTFFMTFAGSYRGAAHVHHEDPWMTVPLMVLAVPSLCIGLLLSGLVPGMPAFAAYIIPAGGHAGHVLHSFSQLMNPVSGLATLMFALGLITAWFFYGTTAGQAIPKAIAEKWAPSLYDLFSHKWYFDEIYQSFVDDAYLVFARFSAWFDRSAIDGIANGTGMNTMSAGLALRQLQSGKLQAYVAIFFFGIVTLSLLMYFFLF
ncbi:MAG: NADH-quinone oxidoreductase subunit L [Candidatus Melainabacteria bacterium]